MKNWYPIIVSLCVGVSIGFLIAQYYPMRTLFIRMTIEPHDARYVSIQEWSLDREHWREAQRAWNEAPAPVKVTP